MARRTPVHLNCIRETRSKLDRNELATVRSARAAGLACTEIDTNLGVAPDAAERRWHEVDPVRSAGG